MNTIKYSYVLLATSMLLGGCTPSNSQSQSQGQGQPESLRARNAQMQTTPAENQPDPKEAESVPHPTQSQRVPTVTNGSNDQRSLTQKAQDIANVVTRLPGVERAAVLLIGHTALVGVDLRSDISGSKIDTLKFSVKEAVQHSGSGAGYRAVVSADVDTVTRIKKMANGVKQGKPVSSFADEIADILSRLLPEV